MTAHARLVVIGLALCSTGALSECPRFSFQPPGIQCSDFSLSVEPNTCRQFGNPCAANGEWTTSPPLDAIRLGGFNDRGIFIERRPASVSILTERSAGHTTRSICAGPTPIVNESLVFTYARGAGYGTGHLTLTVSTPVTVAPSATPARIDPGASSQLVASVSGGIGSYSYNWVPTSGLNQTNVPTPLASPSVTTTYTVSVTDGAGQTTTGQVTVSVNMTLVAQANPRVIEPGEPSQLHAITAGGLLPYRFSWSPADTLSDPTISNPGAGPAQTTTYTVTATDANGVTRHASTTVWVSDMTLFASASPDTIVAGESSQLGATAHGGTPPYTFSWEPRDGLDNPTIQNPVASPTVTTAYVVTATDSQGVSPQAVAHVTVNGLRVIASALPSLVNPAQPAQLDVAVQLGTPPYSFQWFRYPGAGLSREWLPPSDRTLRDPIVSPTLTTAYEVDVQDSGGLFGRGRVIVRVPLLVGPSAMPPGISPGGSSQLAANVTGGGPFANGYNCTWMPQTGLDNPRTCNPVASPAATTSYTVSVQDFFGAVAAGQATVTVNTTDPAPIASFTWTGNPTTVFLDASASTGNIAAYAWDLSWTLTNPDMAGSTPFATFQFFEGESGTITLTVTAVDGRTASVTRSFPR